ncbi:MAG: hypothetical protein JXQ23_01195, partial [Clostridia bacterium]|nr:hypothetical protein [Clostridia bacterium]
YEGEDIEILFCIYDNQELISKEELSLNYVKPMIAGQVALMALLKRLVVYKEQEIVVIVNDNLLYESVRGTLQTKKTDVLRKISETRKKLAEFKNFQIENVSGDFKETEKWMAALKG